MFMRQPLASTGQKRFSTLLSPQQNIGQQALSHRQHQAERSLQAQSLEIHRSAGKRAQQVLQFFLH